MKNGRGKPAKREAKARAARRHSGKSAKHAEDQGDEHAPATNRRAFAV